MSIYLAQSKPTDAKPVQRIIEVEGENLEPELVAKNNANSSVIYGLLTVMLVILAIGLATYLLRKQHQKNKQ
jgi:hypothetical protein